MLHPSYVSVHKRKTKKGKSIVFGEAANYCRFSTFMGALLNITQRKARDDGVQAFLSRK